MQQFMRWSGVVVSAVAVLFSFLTYYGFWGHVRGDDLLSSLADRLDTSYAEDVSRQVRPTDPEWCPLMRVIKEYSRAKLPKDKQPSVFARMVAVSSAKYEVEGNLIAEWTAPTTPIALLYKQWPDPGTGGLEKGQDFFTVGTLGDFHEWIKKDQADFDFLWRTLIFGALSVCVGLFLVLSDKRNK